MENVKVQLKSNDDLSKNILLYNKIKTLLIKEIRKHNKNYIYFSVDDLKNKSMKYLDYTTQIYAILTYNVMTNPFRDNAYNQKMLIEIYNTLELYLKNKKDKAL